MAMSVVYTVVNGEVLSENRGGVKRDYMPDTLGSTVALLDDTQTKTDTWTYWPYGEVKTRTGTNATPFTYVGTLGYFKDELTRLYVRARYLRVDLGQWMTVDPLWPDEPEFAYARSAPTSRSDARGLAACPPPPPPQSGSRKLCEQLCDTLICGGLPPGLKQACAISCKKTQCKGNKDFNRNFFYRKCRELSYDKCNACCKGVCHDKKGWELGICLKNCGAGCDPQRLE